MVWTHEDDTAVGGSGGGAQVALGNWFTPTLTATTASLVVDFRRPASLCVKLRRHSARGASYWTTCCASTSSRMDDGGASMSELRGGAHAGLSERSTSGLARSELQHL